jgi:hypothetical protein
MNITTTTRNVKKSPARSAWKKGVKNYALILLDELKENYSGRDICNANLLKKALLNGAADWSQYSWGGCSFIYDGQIAEMLCSASELKRTKHGELRPNNREEWLDVQARALYQAYRLIRNCAGF